MLKNVSVISTYNTDNIAGLEKDFELKKIRRMDFFSKLALKSAVNCLKIADIRLEENKNIGLIVATGYGPVKKTCDFMDSIIDFGDECASPNAFSSSVHNSALTTISILLNIKGPSLTVSNLDSSFQSALAIAQTWLSCGTADKVLVGAVDEIHTVAQSIIENNVEVFKDFSNKNVGFGSAFFLLEKSDNNIDVNLENKADNKFYPSCLAMELSKKYSLILDKQDIETICCDFIKTELSKKYKNVLNVFENDGISNIFTDVDDTTQQEILKTLSSIFSKETVTVNKNFIVDEIFNLFKKNKFINFLTSGSTGISKQCKHSQDNIKEEVSAVLPLFKDIKRIVCLVPSFHSYGFIFGLQLSKRLNVELIKMPPIPTTDWNNVLQDNDLFVTFPMFLNQLVKLEYKFTKKVTVLTSTAPCPKETMDGLYDNGVNTLTEIYGASEAGAIGYRNKSSEGFKLLPCWEPKLNNNTMVSIKRKNSDMEIELPDNVELFEDNRFKPVSRKDNAVQVAGINVYPNKVKDILCKFENVKEAAVRLSKPEEGNFLKAFIVLKDSNTDKEQFMKNLKVYMKQSLTAHETPKKITLGTELPKTQFGKMKDWQE
ncbi:MAG: beta-ketoacyl synthase chain length factor [Elusimicrobia bacterium]|nr:beta-ketoacyl synthase chain length factor [Elusimicrobiota bacterium]